ncbi:phage tail assembly protein [Herbaspirillum chlorophenolicum]|uniref:phage tail assembly protein n=1 Tax=Herbaspirillum chlorophenolicum TaxID=211589 RepID=UPI00067CD49F|nr:phage tail assembly protein [Herbaspirillum chlorophenolicum]
MANLTLKYPLTLGKTSIKKLTFRDYTVAGDYLSFDVRGGVAQRIALIASLTGTDEEIVKQLRGPDYQAAANMADAMINADEEQSTGNTADPEESEEDKAKKQGSPAS